MNAVAENLKKVRKRIERAARKTGRQLSDIELVVVTKNVPVNMIKQAIAAGVNTIGENKAQELLDKYDQIGDEVDWHFVGHLQRNKVKNIIGLVSLIQSLDSLRLAEEIETQAAKIGKVQHVLVEVNIGEEASKFGLAPADLIGFITDVSKRFKFIRIKGLMSMAPLFEDPEEVRPLFTTMKSLFEQSKTLDLTGVEMDILSMGMSNDFEVAIEEGATMVRIGTAIFQKSDIRD